jgi:hypothetical protein
MTEIIPDRLSIDPNSKWFDADSLKRGVGVRFKDRERRDVEEYCISEGWIRVQTGKTMDRHGKPLTIKLSGVVEVWFETPAPDNLAPDAASPSD